jgi:predicted unusual protein kinase regulating ubiquinone biosynthesis (AarF/ABC1/UbiB family)
MKFSPRARSEPSWKRNSFDKTFASFDPVAIGSASIGQVHRATRDGTNVVVKVCYPNVEALLTGDVRTSNCSRSKLSRACSSSRRDRSSFRELDYRKEAGPAASETIHQSGSRWSRETAKFPKPYMELHKTSFGYGRVTRKQIGSRTQEVWEIRGS